MGDETGKVRLRLRVGPPRPLVATLTEAELALVAPVLPEVAEVVRRGDFSRIRLGTAFHDAIGRDPFRQENAVVRRDESSWSWWKTLGAVVIGVGFAQDDSLWKQILGYGFAALALGDFVGDAWRRLRRWHRTRR
ncbi:hypothetical protein [Paractinoplanes durhamensis]|uniref:Uncharacterized protein n=1 Tax=Paractinoplanes durhamensis TaxID=113563 RepID=A0ABQ3ZAA7_9ACTN|nr:hypothetical protein [Actinoplanes durhamensis]GIE06773.1 hypothetical protein Adu01nite_81230 [Actinoplanes durhamensis]